MNFAWDKEHLDPVIKKNIDFADKRVVVVVPIPPCKNFTWANEEIEYFIKTK